MRSFQQMVQEDFETINLMARGGQKIVFDAHHKLFGQCVVKLYFQPNNPRSLREVEIEKNINLPMVPSMYETGAVEYEGVETLYIIEQKVKGTELRKLIDEGIRFSLKEAVYFIIQEKIKKNYNSINIGRRKILHF